MEPTIIFDNVSKKFSKGYVSDSLRDAFAAPFKRLFGRNNRFEPVKQINPAKPLKQGRDEFWALKDVSFEVRPGEALGIIGPNGSGKSTTLKLLSRILRPDGGSIIVKGRVGALIELGAGFHPDLTGRENVFLNASILGMSKEEIMKKYDEIVDFAELHDFMDMPVKWYSTGMFARLGFSIAAHTSPQILLVDEVLSVGDFSFQKKCIDKMHSFKKEGVTVVFVSHNMEAIASLCDRAILLNNGDLIAAGATEEIVSFYLKEVDSPSKYGATNCIRLEKGLLYNEHGIQSGLFKSSDKGFVDFCINFEDDFPKIYITVFVTKKDGTFVFGVDTTRFIGRILSLKKGQKISLKVKLTFNLVPGEYKVGTAIYDVTDSAKEVKIFSEVFASIIVEDALGYYGTAHLEPVLINESIQ